MRAIIVVCLCLVWTTSFAKDRVLVSNFQTSSQSVSDTELLALTERVLVIVSEIKTYDLITKENILTLLPPDRNLEECVGECEVETGRLVGASKVISGWVVKSRDLYQLTIKLHDTKTGVLEKAKLVSSANFEGVLSQLQTMGSSLLRSDTEIESDLESRLHSIRSKRLQKERERQRIERERWRKRRLEQEKLRAKQRKLEEQERLRKLKLLLEEQKGGVKSKRAFLLESPFEIDRGMSVCYGKCPHLYRFKFHPEPKPYLTLQNYYKTPKWVLSEDGTFKRYLRKSRHFMDSPSIETIDLTQVAGTLNGKAYDKEGRLLEPVRYHTGNMQWTSPTYVYVNKPLIQEDIDNYRKGKGKRAGALLGYLLNGLFSVGIPVNYMSITLAGKEPNPYLFGSLLGVNVALYGVIWWFTRDTNEYHYPQYVGKGIYTIENSRCKVGGRYCY